MKIDEIIKLGIKGSPILESNFSTYSNTKEEVYTITWNKLNIFYKVDSKVIDEMIRLDGLKFGNHKILRHKNNFYIEYSYVLETEICTISTEDLDDKDYLFNLSIQLSTKIYDTLLIAKSVSSCTEDSFVLYTDEIKKYNESKK